MLLLQQGLMLLGLNVLLGLGLGPLLLLRLLAPPALYEVRFPHSVAR